jgi:hypothetical protein
MTESRGRACRFSVPGSRFLVRSEFQVLRSSVRSSAFGQWFPVPRSSELGFDLLFERQRSLPPRTPNSELRTRTRNAEPGTPNSTAHRPLLSTCVEPISRATATNRCTRSHRGSRASPPSTASAGSSTGATTSPTWSRPSRSACLLRRGHAARDDPDVRVPPGDIQNL